MTFFRSIVLLASAVLCVAFALFAGYGLARHEALPVVVGVVLLALGAALVFAQARPGRQA
jgi:ABC-type glycerol-3-phosphate transport system permease component